MYPAGKLPAAHLEALLRALPRRDPRLLVGPRPGEDAAVIEMGDGRCLVVATDPITFATDRIGSYAVHVNANDVAVMGARPRWLFLVLLLPAGSADAALVDRIMADAVTACDSLGITLCGGHTEITGGLDRPIAIGQMLGEVACPRLVRKESLRPGDVVILTQAAGIEGTAILAREKRDALQRHVADRILDRAAAFLDDPGISVVRAALAAAATGAVRAMHDPTEGGVASGLLELAAAAGLGIAVDGDGIPIRPESREICAALDVDPLRLIASGALLIGTPPSSAPVVLDALGQQGIPATVVAQMRPPGHDATMTRQGRSEPLVLPARDEIARVFECSAGEGPVDLPVRPAAHGAGRDVRQQGDDEILRRVDEEPR